MTYIHVPYPASPQQVLWWKALVALYKKTCLLTDVSDPKLWLARHEDVSSSAMVKLPRAEVLVADHFSLSRLWNILSVPYDGHIYVGGTLCPVSEFEMYFLKLRLRQNPHLFEKYADFLQGIYALLSRGQVDMHMTASTSSSAENSWVLGMKGGKFFVVDFANKHFKKAEKRLWKILKEVPLWAKSLSKLEVSVKGSAYPQGLVVLSLPRTCHQMFSSLPLTVDVDDFARLSFLEKNASDFAHLGLVRYDVSCLRGYGLSVLEKIRTHMVQLQSCVHASGVHASKKTSPRYQLHTYTGSSLLDFAIYDYLEDSIDAADYQQHCLRKWLRGCDVWGSGLGYFLGGDGFVQARSWHVHLDGQGVMECLYHSQAEPSQKQKQKQKEPSGNSKLVGCSLDDGKRSL
ncbi:MAG: hypothetical protein OXC44_07720 [Proteobacteria bacterium]|nr:hypothetical protein [Pseudomonadota bacterium]